LFPESGASSAFSDFAKIIGLITIPASEADAYEDRHPNRSKCSIADARRVAENC
jgi:hypothetical protein